MLVWKSHKHGHYCSAILTLEYDNVIPVYPFNYVILWTLKDMLEK